MVVDERCLRNSVIELFSLPASEGRQVLVSFLCDKIPGLYQIIHCSCGNSVHSGWCAEGGDIIIVIIVRKIVTSKPEIALSPSIEGLFLVEVVHEFHSGWDL